MKVGRCITVVLRGLLSVVSAVLMPVIDWVFGKIYDSTAQTVTPVKDELLLLPAVTLANRIRARKLTAVELMERYISRVKEVTPLLNAVIAERFEEALKEARALDKALEENPSDERFLESRTPFLGIPMSVKEAFAVTGMPNTGGLVARKGQPAEADCPVVRLMRKAGGIPYCVTNISELCMWYESNNMVYGRSNNPYNTGRTVGGSSGGEGCNIGSGAAVIGIGSDIGGSIRMPAFFNGIWGHKPSRGIVDSSGQFPVTTGKDGELLATGPMCRYIEDLLPMLKIMSQPNSHHLKLDTEVDLRSLRYFSVPDDGGSLLVSTVNPQLKAAQLKAVDYLRETVGMEVETKTIPKFRYSLEMWQAKMSTSEGTKFCEYMTNFNGQINPYLELLKWLVKCSDHTLPCIALGMVEKLDFLLDGANEVSLKGFDKLEKEMEELLGNDGVLLYPSHPRIAPYHNHPLFTPFNFAYTGVFNALGFPVTQVPMGLSKEGLPLGIQVVASMNNDHLALAVAKQLSKGVAGWVNPGSV